MNMLPLVCNSLRWPSLSRPALKWIAMGYAVKSVAFGVAWYFIPDLPGRLAAGTRAVWSWLLGP